MKIDFPARYVFAILGFLGFAMVYIMRVNLSVAIVAMVNSSANAVSDKNSSFLACHELYLQLQNQTSLSKTKSLGEFDWDPNTQSLILGAFFYGYVVTQIPGGIIAEKWNAKWLFGLGVLITSILTILSPIAARWSVQAFVAVRILEGFAECFLVRMIQCLYVGMIGCIWFMFWTFLIYERPEDHPRISLSELSYIRKDQANKTVMKIPWTSILTSIRVWALAITYFGQTWGFYTMVSEMPTYLANILHFDIEQNGMLSSLPYILQTIVSWIGGYIADKMRESGRFTITTIRKLFNSLGFFGSGLCILFVAFVGCRPTISVALLCAALGFNGLAYSGYKITHVDMSPGLAGRIKMLDDYTRMDKRINAPPCYSNEK